MESINNEIMSIFKRMFSFTNTTFPQTDKSGNVFYPMFLNGRDSNPKWLNIKDVSMIYECIPHLKIVINRKASMFANMKFKTVDENGEMVENAETQRVLALLRQPNPVQSQQHWLMQFKIYEQLYGAAFTHMIRGIDPVPRAMWNLPSALMEVKLTGKIYKQFDLDEIIEKYELNQSSGDVLNFDRNEIIHSIVPSTENPITGECKLKSLQKPISNIAGSLQFRNVIINNKGALGILSAESKDAGGPIPLNQTERQAIEKQHREMYGIGDDQSKIIITETPMKWQPMTFRTKDLALFEEVLEDYQAIIDAFGLNRNQFSFEKGSTFENLREGDKIAYQNTIIPESHDFTQLLTNAFETKEKGFIIKPSFDHLPLLQENLTEKANAIKSIVDAAIALQGAGFTDQATQLLDHVNDKR